MAERYLDVSPGGNLAYLIGYLDDYSRYMVGCELFRSQTAENVLEVHPTARSLSFEEIDKVIPAVGSNGQNLECVIHD